MHLLVLPVSGPKFANQLSIVKHLADIDYRPDIQLATSGGNLVAYLASAADWNKYKIDMLASKLNNNLLLSQWSLIPVISNVMGFFKGTVYNKGDGVEKLLSSFLTSESIKKYEIWTGTYNIKLNRVKIFCNKSKNDVRINYNKLNSDILHCTECIFADGDISCVTNYSVASACIPGIVPHRTIFEEPYVDGGVFSPSPLTIMSNIIKETLNKDEPLHITYVNPIDIDNNHHNYDKIMNLLDNYKKVADSVFNSQRITERLIAHNLICDLGKEITQVFFPCNKDNLKLIKNITEIAKYSLLEIYPNKSSEIDLNNFQGKDVIDCMDKTYNNCSCRFYVSLENSDKITINKYLNSIKTQ